MSEQAAAVLRQTNFTTLDWVIVAVYLAVSVAVGLWVNRYIHSMTAYVSAGRQFMPVVSNYVPFFEQQIFDLAHVDPDRRAAGCPPGCEPVTRGPGRGPRLRDRRWSTCRIAS